MRPRHRRTANASGAQIVALVPDAYGSIGGIAQYNRDLIEALSTNPKVCGVDVIARVAPREDAWRPQVPFRVEFRATRGTLLSFVASVLRRLLQRRPIDVVICAHINLLPVAVVLATIRRAPLLLGVYGIDVWEAPRRRISHSLLRRVDLTYSISEITLSRMETWAGPMKGSVILPNAIDIASFAQEGRERLDAVRARFGLEGRRVIMTAGRLVSAARAKGFDEVISVLKEVGECVEDVHYVIMGAGPDESRLRQLARHHGVEDRVVFTGYVDDATRASLYQIADAFVMPSRGEGFGFVLLEAMASGTPTIASSADGGREALRGGLLGELVNPDRPSELVRAISWALARGRAVPRGLEEFSVHRHRDRVARMLEQILGE